MPWLVTFHLRHVLSVLLPRCVGTCASIILPQRVVHVRHRNDRSQTSSPDLYGEHWNPHCPNGILSGSARTARVAVGTPWDRVFDFPSVRIGRESGPARAGRAAHFR